MQWLNSKKKVIFILKSYDKALQIEQRDSLIWSNKGKLFKVFEKYEDSIKW